MVHYYSAVGHYALPSEDQKQMLLWAHCCELEGLSWSDQLWSSCGEILNKLERLKREQQEYVALGTMMNW